MTTSLIITTYNWPQALELSLKSILGQTKKPDEIIIADDGSTDDTKNLIEQISNGCDIKIIHSWQEDNGFRAARSRNLAISKSNCEYIICIDGDMILDKDFIQDHLKCKSKGFYIQGSRVLLSPRLTKEILLKKEFKAPTLFSKEIKNNLNGIKNKFLSFFICSKSSRNHKGVKSCNFSFYKDDFLKVNGFNENFTSWGREDSEFIERLYNIGIKRKNLKFAGIQYHLYHNEGSSSSSNDSILKNAIEKKLQWCENGINKHLEEKNG
ncbi:MAG: glycosyltransferase family 2 protein [Sulfurimonas sp.]|uniref:glycosyltransferase family 2 protein n=1 Tax=Sulfurimonas sp. TaxID=2022749 RepID=UPI00262A8454|nr:glycosyltransferase family 2 protein [Sulfurimonas sp.]MDD2653095.1 glycosyltransferase family 2 protein [Sulfurimonas sp.]MDD3452482.1 glycosyltransferase family 2 protein [Sulfurimonas sp.]